MNVELKSGGITLPYQQTLVNYCGRIACLAATTLYTPASEFARALGLRGYKPFNLFELSPCLNCARTFRLHVASAKASHGPLGACLHLCEAHEYRQMRLFTDEEGLAGFALHGREIVSVFSHAIRKQTRALPTLIALAVQLGGVHLTCFDTNLTAMYRRSGFEETRRVSWNDELAPNGWNYAALSHFSNGRPDVVSMVGGPGTTCFEAVK